VTLPSQAAKPSFKEIYDLVQTNLVDVKTDDLDQAAIEGLLSKYQDRVRLFTNGLAMEDKSITAFITKTQRYDGKFIYLRLNQVETGLSEKLSAAYASALSSNAAKGLILDLRYANGGDYQEAAKVAGLFLAEERPLIEWKGEMLKSSAKADAIKGNVIVLINRFTSGASEVLAALLRENQSGLLLGSVTAGKAALTRDYLLSSGHLLRIAAVPVKTGSGAWLGAQGIRPDSAVNVAEADEKIWFTDEYWIKPIGNISSTNSVARTNRSRMNEAELVRMKKEGLDAEIEANTIAQTEATKLQLVQDITLSRALDLLKALAIVQSVKK
jgi:C-terminal processing protease CtpA/Prc